MSSMQRAASRWRPAHERVRLARRRGSGRSRIAHAEGRPPVGGGRPGALRRARPPGDPRPYLRRAALFRRQASRAAIARLLISRGWSAATPAAICLAAGTDRALTWIGALDALGTAPLSRAHPDAPGTIVIGEVVKAGAAIAAALFPQPAALAQSQAV